MRLLEVGFAYEEIQDFHEGEIVAILAILMARDKKVNEDRQANANRR